MTRSALCFGAPEGIRTPNLLIRSQMLYPLSYGRMSAAGQPVDYISVPRLRRTRVNDGVPGAGDVWNEQIGSGAGRSRAADGAALPRERRTK